MAIRSLIFYIAHLVLSKLPVASMIFTLVYNTVEILPNRTTHPASPEHPSSGNPFYTTGSSLIGMVPAYAYRLHQNRYSTPYSLLLLSSLFHATSLQRTTGNPTYDSASFGSYRISAHSTHSTPLARSSFLIHLVVFHRPMP